MFARGRRTDWCAGRREEVHAGFLFTVGDRAYEIGSMACRGNLHSRCCLVPAFGRVGTVRRLDGGGSRVLGDAS